MTERSAGAALDAVVAACARDRLPEAWAVYVFGTAGTEWERPDSDLDVGVLGPPRPWEAGPMNLAGLAEALEIATGRTVDAVDLRRAPPVLAKEVIFGGRLVWDRRPLETGLWELWMMAEYQRLCERRAGIVEEGLRSGFHP